jgi:flavin reductase
MSRVAAAVHIVAVRDDDVMAGVTATAVCSLTDSPSSLLVCLHREGRVGCLMRPGISMSVNTLRAGQHGLADVFAGRGRVPMEERFRHGTWQTLPGEAPVLMDGIASFMCSVGNVSEAGSHYIVIGHVTDIRTTDAQEALLYGARKYRTLPLRAGES